MQRHDPTLYPLAVPVEHWDTLTVFPRLLTVLSTIVSHRLSVKL